MAHARLTTGWEADLRPDDTLQRSHLRAFADFSVEATEAAGGRVRRDDDLVLADSGLGWVLSSAAIVRRPLSGKALRAAASRARAWFAAGAGGPWGLFSAWPTPPLDDLGFGLGGHPPLMVRSPGGVAPPDPPGITIEPVTSDAAWLELERTVIEAYPAPELHDAAPGTFLPPTVRATGDVHGFLARLDGRPVATAIGIARHGANHVEWISARPEVRGRGLGAAITWRATTVDPRLPAALIASDEGRPVYERLGYVAVERLTFWAGPRG